MLIHINWYCQQSLFTKKNKNKNEELLIRVLNTPLLTKIKFTPH